MRTMNDGIYDQFFMLLFTPIAVGTLLTWLAQMLHLEFATYSHLTVASCGLSLLILFVQWFRAVRRAMSSRPASALWLLLGLALIGAVPALLYNRPNGDSYFYLANVVHYLRFPTEAMTLEVKFIATLGAPLQSFIWSTSGPYEYIQGAFAHVFSIDLLDIYYFMATAMAGVLTVVSLTYLTRLFLPTDTAAVTGAACALILILCLFEYVITPGNLYFARAYEGKIVCLTALQPIFAAFSLQFLDSSRNKYLVYLLVTVVAGIGMTASAAVLLPMFAAVLSASVLFVNLRQKRHSPSDMLLRAAKYCACLGPCLVFLLVYRTYFSDGLASDSLANAFSPTTVIGHLNLLLFLTPDIPHNQAQPVGISYTAVAFSLSSAAVLCLTKGYARQLIALWLITTFVLFLNPWAGDLLIRVLHLENIFWRVFFILPFPLVAAISAALLFDRIQMSIGIRTIAAAGCAILLLLASVLIPYLRGESTFPPAHKLPSARNPELQEVIRIGGSLREGVTLAPFEVSSLLAIHHPHLKLITLYNEIVWLDSINMREDGERRIRASVFLGTVGEGNSDDFFYVVNKYRPANIIVSRHSYKLNRAMFDLLSPGYSKIAVRPGYVFYGRRDSAASRRSPEQPRTESAGFQ